MKILTKIVLSLILLISCCLTSESRIKPKIDAEPEKVTLCKLESDRAAYNHKLIEVTGFASYGFEDFTFFDPTCPQSRFAVWLEYGGKATSGTVYCCGETISRVRPKSLVIEDMPVPLIEDESFQTFHKLLHLRGGSIIRATLVGRFFSGKKTENRGEIFWEGYGHFGCCSLLAIQQVAAVDTNERSNLDYGSSVDQPGADKVGCGYQILDVYGKDESPIQAQQKAEADQSEFSFDDPRRVAAGFLAKTLKVDEKSIQGIKETRKAQGRYVYEWQAGREAEKYMLVVSRPYWLSFYAKDSKKTAWVVTAAYKPFCD